MKLFSLASGVNVFWNLRLKSTAGLAYHDSIRIDLNTRLQRFYPEEPNRTLLHELAHLIANHRASGSRIQPHGIEWQRACSELGIPGEKRCHDLPLAPQKLKKKLAYRCRYCGVIVPRVKNSLENRHATHVAKPIIEEIIVEGFCWRKFRLQKQRL